MFCYKILFHFIEHPTVPSYFEIMVSPHSDKFLKKVPNCSNVGTCITKYFTTRIVLPILPIGTPLGKSSNFRFTGGNQSCWAPTVEVLYAPDVILLELPVADVSLIVRIHDSGWIKGVVQTKEVTYFVSCNLQQTGSYKQTSEYYI